MMFAEEVSEFCDLQLAGIISKIDDESNWS
jgi:hypothetical protein